MLEKPNLFIVGAAKAGTTSVYNYLKDHPDVYMSPIKEPNYFGSDIEWEDFREDHKRNTKLDFEAYFSEKTLEEKHIAFVGDKSHYLRLFRNSKDFKVRGEVSTSYLYSSLAAGEIYDFNPEAKIIIILRDPIDRAISHYLMDYARGSQKGENILDDLKEDFNCTRKGYCISNLYLDLSLYHGQIQRYIDVFAKDRILLMHYENLKEDPNKFMSEIFNFLDIQDQKIDTDQIFNTTKKPRNTIIRYASKLKGRLPSWIVRIIKSKKHLFFESVSKQVVPDEALNYIKANVKEDWENTKSLIENFQTSRP